ncbi:hypothetical protein L6452_44084 [Arctium lappa]|uniref:Uncharacterized protein n=1 Tax=Arctium lappa TaxID=4217 RepID=A0ACB8XFI5_ARCLA|nr:hypothetical protein L6452_44084 [Arctium lappa]
MSSFSTCFGTFVRSSTSKFTYLQMRNTVAFLVLLLAATTIVCRSSEEQGDGKESSSWTDWAMAKVAGVFNGDKVKETANNVANQASDAASVSSSYVSEKAVEAEDAAADAAKKLSDDKGHGIEDGNCFNAHLVPPTRGPVFLENLRNDRNTISTNEHSVFRW